MSNCWSSWWCCGGDRDKNDEISKPLIIADGSTESSLSGRTYSVKKGKKSKATAIPSPIQVHTSFDRERTFSSFPHSPVSGIKVDSEIPKLKEKVEQLTKELTEAGSELQRTQTDAEAALKKVEKLQERIATQKKTIQSLGQDKSALELLRDALSEELQKLKDQGEAETREPSVVTIEQSDSSSLLEEAETRYKAESQELQSKIEDLIKQNNKLTQALEKASNETVKIQEKRDRERRVNEQTEQDLRDTIENLNEKIKGLNIQLKSTTTRLDNNRRSSKEADEREEEIQKKAEEIGSVEKAIEEISRLEKIIEKLEERNTYSSDAYEKQMEELRIVIADVRKGNEYDKYTKELRSENADLIGQVSKLKEQIEIQKEQIAEQSDKIKDQSERLHTLQSNFEIAASTAAALGGVKKTDIPKFKRYDSTTTLLSPTEQTRQTDQIGNAYENETIREDDLEESNELDKTNEKEERKEIEKF